MRLPLVTFMTFGILAKLSTIYAKKYAKKLGECVKLLEIKSY